jgi:hypothetical protein
LIFGFGVGELWGETGSTGHERAGTAALPYDLAALPVSGKTAGFEGGKSGKVPDHTKFRIKSADFSWDCLETRRNFCFLAPRLEGKKEAGAVSRPG